MLIRFFRRHRENHPQAPSIEDILKDENGHWHEVYTKSRIIDAEELLHLQLFWSRVARFWLFVITPGLVAASSLVYFQVWQVVQPAYLYGAAIASAVASPTLAYRQYRKIRRTRHAIRRLNLIYRLKLADSRQGVTDGVGFSPLLQQKRYRQETVDVIASLHERANRSSRRHNYLQGVIIIGSVSASALTTASVAFSETRWVAVGLTAAMGLAAAFSGYYKFHDRSLSSRQAADSIEREYEAVELRVGRYRGLSEEDAYARFAEVVERLRDEHAKRQQQLDQHMEVKRDEP